MTTRVFVPLMDYLRTAPIPFDVAAEVVDRVLAVGRAHMNRAFTPKLMETIEEEANQAMLRVYEAHDLPTDKLPKLVLGKPEHSIGDRPIIGMVLDLSHLEPP